MQLHGSLSAEPRDEGARVAELIAAEIERDPKQSIAVLVQARGHLPGLREKLRARGWPVHAVEIDALGEQPVGSRARSRTGTTESLGSPCYARPGAGSRGPTCMRSVTTRGGARSSISCATPSGSNG